MKYYIVYNSDFTWHLICCALGIFPFKGCAFFDEICEEEFNRYIDFVKKGVVDD